MGGRLDLGALFDGNRLGRLGILEPRSRHKAATDQQYGRYRWLQDVILAYRFAATSARPDFVGSALETSRVRLKCVQ